MSFSPCQCKHWCLWTCEWELRCISLCAHIQVQELRCVCTLSLPHTKVGVVDWFCVPASLDGDLQPFLQPVDPDTATSLMDGHESAAEFRTCAERPAAPLHPPVRARKQRGGEDPRAPFKESFQSNLSVSTQRPAGRRSWMGMRPPR